MGSKSALLKKSNKALFDRKKRKTMAERGACTDLASVGEPTREEVEELVQWGQFPVSAEDEAQWLVVRVQGGQVVGYLQYQQEVMIAAASIHFLEVKGECMGKGYGRLLVAWLQERYAHLRAHIVVDSEGFWRTMGFVSEYPGVIEAVDWYWWREEEMWW
jgi:ribosomal protein S18 acetylase RimI-like enzyme